eukprot:scaffold65587_cov46-Phaeocystis_antarctica.AAC.2
MKAELSRLADESRSRADAIRTLRNVPAIWFRLSQTYHLNGELNYHLVVGGGGVSRVCAPGCASRPHEGGRAASEVDHHARRRPLVARSHGWNVRRARAERTEGTSRSDFSKRLLQRTSGSSYPPNTLRQLLSQTV